MLFSPITLKLPMVKINLYSTNKKKETQQTSGFIAEPENIWRLKYK